MFIPAAPPDLVRAQALAEGRQHLLADYRGLPQGFVYASAGEYLVASGAIFDLSA